MWSICGHELESHLDLPVMLWDCVNYVSVIHPASAVLTRKLASALWSSNDGVLVRNLPVVRTSLIELVAAHSEPVMLLSLVNSVSSQVTHGPCWWQWTWLRWCTSSITALSEIYWLLLHTVLRVYSQKQLVEDLLRPGPEIDFFFFFVMSQTRFFGGWQYTHYHTYIHTQWSVGIIVSTKYQSL